MKDGHTHSEFCPHGSKKPTLESIRHAVKLGFSEISVTEHAPLPDAYLDDPVLFSECNLLPQQLEAYLQHVGELKRRFAGSIRVLTGFEIDFLPDQPQTTLRQISELAPVTEDFILSLHVLPFKQKPRLIDYSPAMFDEQLIKPLGSLYAVYRMYLEAYTLLIRFAGELPVKVRLGHPMLIWKFSKVFPLTPEEYAEVEAYVCDHMIPLIAQNRLEVDFNVAGFDIPTCGRAYLSENMITACLKAGVPLVFGSDAHAPDKIGRYYPFYRQAVDR